MTFQKGGETGQVGEGRLNKEQQWLEGGVVGSRQSSAVERGTGVGRKTSFPLRDVKPGMGTHEPTRGSAHSRRCASLREGFYRRPGHLCSNIRARHKSCFATACWGALRSVGPSGQDSQLERASGFTAPLIWRQDLDGGWNSTQSAGGAHFWSNRCAILLTSNCVLGLWRLRKLSRHVE